MVEKHVLRGLLGINRLVLILGAVIVLGWSCAELLPVVFGTGFGARWDWSFIYVTAKFMLLPTISVIEVAIVTPIAIVRDRAAGRWPWPSCASSAVSVIYLVALYYHPEFWLV